MVSRTTYNRGHLCSYSVPQNLRTKVHHFFCLTVSHPLVSNPSTATARIDILSLCILYFFSLFVSTCRIHQRCYWTDTQLMTLHNVYGPTRPSNSSLIKWKLQLLKQKDKLLDPVLWNYHSNIILSLRSRPLLLWNLMMMQKHLSPRQLQLSCRQVGLLHVLGLFEFPSDRTGTM